MPRARSSTRTAVLAALVAAEVLAVAAVTAVALLVPVHPEPPSGAPGALARVVPALGAAPDAASLAAREAAVRRLLVARAAALEARDRAAFLATVDPRATAFRARQARLFDALEGVPARGWHYELDPSREQSRDPVLDARYGTWWAPEIVLRYRLGEADDLPTAERQALTLVQHAGHWRVAADDDFDRLGARTARALWDSGPVEVVERDGVLVLGHPGRRALLEEVARTARRAVPRVTRLWGPWPERVVVLVPRDAEELGALVRSEGDLSRLAALAVAEVSAGDGRPVGERVVVHPEVFAGLSGTGRRIVMTHEVAHVATRAASGPHSPTWLVEGLADLAGHSGLDLPLSVAAGELRAQVRAQGAPEALPSDDDFAPDAPGLGASYEGAWLAVELLAERHGRAAVLRLYRALGQAGTAQEARRAWEEELGTTPEEFTAIWRRELVERLG